MTRDALTRIYDDHGIRCQYPLNWELEVSDDGPCTTIAVQSQWGPAFVMITLDLARPEPAEMADLALDAMREEYPGLDASPALELVGGHEAVGYDVEFFSLDMVNSCAIRCYRTERRTILVFAQWSDLEGENSEAILRAVRRSLSETDT